MNSEELEQSLRTEFEIYLKDVFADMRQDITQLQQQVETEFEKHKSQLNGVFQEFSARLETGKGLDDVFTETVVEHLRLARDEGARITATAIAEAEDMEKESAPKVGIKELSDAINDITEQTSQAAILKTLVNHAAQFTPRGAFFIIKNEHFVGWRVFGKENTSDDQTVREVFFPLATSTILGEAVRSLSAVESSYGTYAGDSIYLNKLGYGHPDKMFAIPLIARGRGVAVLYADYGTEGESVNVEALEVLVRIAGLTVELLAASPGAKPGRDAEPPPESYESKQPDESSPKESAKTAAADQFDSRAAENESPKEHQTDNVYQPADVYQPSENKPAEFYQSPAAESPTAENYDSSDFETPSESDYQSPNQGGGFSFQPSSDSENVRTDSAAAEIFPTNDYPYQKTPEIQPFDEPYSWNQPEETPADEVSHSWNQPEEQVEEYKSNYSDEIEVQEYSPSYQSSGSETDFSTPLTGGYQFENESSFESPSQFEETPPAFESSPYADSQFETAETPTYEAPQYEAPQNFSFAQEPSYDSYKADEKVESSFNEPAETIVETVVEAAPAAGTTRFSDRNVDLPIEVSEEERRLHNDARRFARLLVSEIKLYNEQKVKEGRDGSDLYERLREAIDRSREMYDKRVQPPVAAKFDYFHYELVNTLAEGEESRLGANYPGAKV